jgi:hypothetical protein
MAGMRLCHPDILHPWEISEQVANEFSNTIPGVLRETAMVRFDYTQSGWTLCQAGRISDVGMT